MADLGTAAIGSIKAAIITSDFSVGLMGVANGPVTLGSSGQGGGPPAPTVPTTGQLWPRGNLVR